MLKALGAEVIRCPSAPFGSAGRSVGWMRVGNAIHCYLYTVSQMLIRTGSQKLVMNLVFFLDNGGSVNCEEFASDV